MNCNDQTKFVTSPKQGGDLKKRTKILEKTHLVDVTVASSKHMALIMLVSLWRKKAKRKNYHSSFMNI